MKEVVRSRQDPVGLVNEENRLRVGLLNSLSYHEYF